MDLYSRRYVYFSANVCVRVYSIHPIYVYCYCFIFDGNLQLPVYLSGWISVHSVFDTAIFITSKWKNHLFIIIKCVLTHLLFSSRALHTASFYFPILCVEIVYLQQCWRHRPRIKYNTSFHSSRSILFEIMTQWMEKTKKKTIFIVR